MAHLAAHASAAPRVTGQYRLMGGLATAGGVCYIIAGIVMGITGDDSHPVADALSLLWAIGSISGLIGIGMLGAVGRGMLGRIALAIATLAYALAAVDALLILSGAYSVEDSPLFVVSRLGTLVGMLLVGIAALVARRWPGWRRFSPFALLVALPVAVAFGVLTGIETIVPFVGAAWTLIGYAVWSTPT